MKTLTVSEAADDLTKWLRLAVAGEEIAIRADDRIVALRPLPTEGVTEKLSPREALGRLQRNPRLPPQDADHYLDEVRAERLAADKSAA